MLTDFGWSTEMTKEDTRMTVCGTPDYLPPEMLHQNGYTTAVDCWTCGVLCYELLMGKAPFTGSVRYFLIPAVLHAYI